jgi:lysozyme
MASAQLLANVKGAEGCKLTAYRDTNGFWTVGYGHKLADNHDWTGYTITSDTANALLIVDLNQASYAAASLPEWPFLATAARQDALIELVFNMGEGGWRKFVRCRAALQAQQWTTAHDQLLQSMWSQQVGPTRSGRLARTLLTGTYNVEAI